MNQKEWGGIILNPSCANYCLFCGKVNTTEEELRQQEENVAKNLIEFKERGMKKIEISGSDPIEYKNIISLVKYMKRMGFESIQLSTHGRQVADEFFLISLVKAGINRFRIPLYGSQAEIHDSITRSSGSFNETFKGISLLRRKVPFIELQISSLIMQRNKDDLINILKLVKKLRIKDFYFSYPFLARPDYSYYIPLKDLGPYVKQAYNHALKINYPIKFLEIPYCVFGFVSELINNNSLPPDLGEHCQPPKQRRTNIKDMPSYRLKKKVLMCEKCKCVNFCDGFPVNDIDKFSTGNLKPIN